jgi:competence CoiA-like predicted nuclease
MVKYKRDEIERYRQWRRREDRKWATQKFPQSWLQQFELHHEWNRGRVLYFLTAKEHRERDKQMRIRNLMKPAEPAPLPVGAPKELIRLKHRDKRYKRFIRNKKAIHCFKRWMRQMSKFRGSKQIYLMTGTEGGWKWRLSLSVSLIQRKWFGSFDFSKVRKLHPQKTIHLLGGGTQYEWQLSVNASEKQEKWGGNFYMRERR